MMINLTCNDLHDLQQLPQNEPSFSIMAKKNVSAMAILPQNEPSFSIMAKKNCSIAILSLKSTHLINIGF
jgi:hypothetical protein